jgi:Rrf2 family protein
MRVPQRVDYALRVLALLAVEPPDTYVAAGELASRLVLPKRFVEQQVTVLARAGIVRSRRGATGGCALALEPSQVTVRDVVLAIQGDVLDVPRQRGQATAEVWRQAAVVLDDFLGEVTLADIASRQREIDAQSAPMYYI